MKKSVLLNFLYNEIYQILVLLIPLITTPYLSRVFNSEELGRYSFYYYIAYYFSICIMLGLNNYGNRSIAKCLGEKNAIEEAFNEIFTMQLLTGFTVLALYLVFLTYICNDKVMGLCFLPLIVASMIDVNWYFYGREQFNIVLIRNSVIKIINAALIFAFVKQPSDLILYAIIISVGILVGQVSVWPIIFKEVKLRRTHLADIRKHFKANLILFIPVIAVSIYRVMDKLMIGMLSDMSQVGLYENSDRIVSTLLSFITALGTVMLPRMSSLYAQKDSEQIVSLVRKSYAFIGIFSSVVTFGVLSISGDLVIAYLGSNYINSIPIVQLLCITIPLISFANITRTQILIPKENEKVYVGSCLAGAFVNFFINLLLIPQLGGVGAAFGTIMAEFSLFIIQFIFTRKEVPMGDSRKTVLAVYLSGLFMMISIIGLDRLILIDNLILELAIKVLFGAVVYCVTVIIFAKTTKDKYLNMFALRLFKKEL